MDITIFLGKVIGWYLVIIAIYVFARRRQLQYAVGQLVNDKSFLLLIAILTIILGLLMVVAHNVWVLSWPVLITIISWLVLLGGLLRLFFPELIIKLAAWWMEHTHYLYLAALIYLLIGLFLLFKSYYLQLFY
jgi:hypothetical protein